MAQSWKNLNVQINQTYGHLVTTEDFLRQIPSAVDNPKSEPLLDNMITYYRAYINGISNLCKKFEVCSTEFDLPEHLNSKEEIVLLSKQLLHLTLKLRFNVKFEHHLRIPAVQKKLQMILTRLNSTNGRYLNYLNYWDELMKEEFERYGRK